MIHNDHVQNIDLAAAVKRKGFTPPMRDLTALLTLLASSDLATAEASVQAIIRMGPAAVAGLLRAFPTSSRPLRGRLVELLGRLAPGDEVVVTLLRQALDDGDLKTQINAATALGRRRSPANEAALLAALARAPRRELAQALVRSLGKTGGNAALATLASPASAVAAPRLVQRAQLILQREVSRTRPSVIDAKALLPAATVVWLYVRRGLEDLLREELKEHGFGAATLVAPGCLAVGTSGPLDAFWKLRLVERLTLPCPPRPGDVEAAAVAALSTAATLLKQLTTTDAGGERGLVRYRINWPQASKAQLWQLAARLTSACPDLVNDPTASTWEFCLSRRSGHTQLELQPKRWLDPRFYYRDQFVPAASHPTIAAALARLAAVQPDDIIWDPFMGSGSELIECALSGPLQAVYGSDSDPDAVAAARANAAKAQLPVLRGDFFSLAPFHTWRLARPTLIVTNPPMGRRVQRGHLQEVLDAFIACVAERLAAGGRLVWLAPLPARTNASLKAAGFALEYQKEVDMGGFTANLQRWRRLPG